MSRYVLLTILLILSTGCASYAFVNGPLPEESSARELSVAQCTNSKTWIIVDGVLAGLYGLAVIAAMSDPEQFEVNYGFNGNTAGLLYAGAGTLGVFSARGGNAKVNECRAAQLGTLVRETSWIGPPLKQ